MTAPLGPYTPVVRAGDWIIVSGQLGMKDGDAGRRRRRRADRRRRSRTCKAQLASMGATLADVAKTLCFLTDMDTFATFNEAYVAGSATTVRHAARSASPPCPCRRRGRDRGLGLQAAAEVGSCAVPGVIAIILVLLIFPVIAIMGSVTVAAPARLPAQPRRRAAQRGQRAPRHQLLTTLCSLTGRQSPQAVATTLGRL